MLYSSLLTISSVILLLITNNVVIMILGLELAILGLTCGIMEASVFLQEPLGLVICIIFLILAAIDTALGLSILVQYLSMKDESSFEQARAIPIAKASFDPIAILVGFLWLIWKLLQETGTSFFYTGTTFFYTVVGFFYTVLMLWMSLFHVFIIYGILWYIYVICKFIYIICRFICKLIYDNILDIFVVCAASAITLICLEPKLIAPVWNFIINFQWIFSITISISLSIIYFLLSKFTRISLVIPVCVSWYFLQQDLLISMILFLDNDPSAVSYISFFLTYFFHYVVLLVTLTTILENENKRKKKELILALCKNFENEKEKILAEIVQSSGDSGEIVAEEKMKEFVALCKKFDKELSTLQKD